ncbi:MAG: CsgG/HfaB family protein, partial [Gemmatimonadota bacterium]|nr:CsgG/HfaB family protein [Gemmatimonadota bacterium]
ASLWAMPGGAKSAQQSSGENAGRAVAGLLIERLLASGNFRVVERAALDAVKTEQDLARGGRPAPDSAGQARGLVGAKYVVTGQITKFGKAKREKGGGIVGMITERVGGFGLGSNETSYEVSLTGRVVEAATGELVTSMTTDGVVIGDNGLVIVGGGASVGGGAVGGFGSQATGEREKRIAEALRSAVDKLVLQLVRARERGDIEP